MTRPVQITTGVARVLAALLDDPGTGRYGLELMRATGQPSGTLYPILNRLLAAGWVHAQWEQIDPVAEGRPARRYYQLTPDGLVAARTELAALYATLRPHAPGDAGSATGRPGTVTPETT